MEIISDFKEEHKETKPKPKPNPNLKPSASPSCSSSSSAVTTSFTASFNPSNPLGFLEKVFHFVAQHSDFLEKVTVEKKILSVARVAKERKEKENESKRRKVEEVKDKKVSVVPKNVTKVPKKEEEEEKFPVKVENKEESGPRAPNLGNGLDLDKYSWTQSLQEVTAFIPHRGSKFDFYSVAKQDQMDWWKCLVKGNPEIDTQKGEPESS
ncbi:hypothetical protein F8388_004546 [Cannabis sativa]|uniref:Uncharacterized protein n=1 Tax=Cannabis sativa TaxID=3483 RepID=A0A7J6GN33_CANSA|nr:hypothetical protein F8388_004546 [Cannabis sativa]